MFFERNQMGDTKYPSYIVFNSGIDVEFITLHRNPESWDFDQDEYTVPRVDAQEVILYNTYGNQFQNGKYIQEPDFITINAKYMPLNPIAHDQLSCDIYRKTPYQKYLEYVGPLDNGFKMYDYSVASNNYYHYIAVATLKEQDGYKFIRYSQKNVENGKDAYYHTQFDKWTISDIVEWQLADVPQNDKITVDDKIYCKTGRVWNIGLNLENPTISQNVGITNWDTQGRFSKTSIGNKRYDSSRFTGLLGGMYEYTDHIINGEGNYDSSIPKLTYGYTERMEYFAGDEKNIGTQCMSQDWSVEQDYGYEMAKLDAWSAFITNGSLKLLKDIKGNAWIIQVVDVPEYTIMQNSNLKQTQISFAWKEVEDARNCSIVSYDNLPTE